VCQRSQEAIAAEGLSRDRLPAMLRRLVEAGFLSRHRVAQVPDTYRLYLPPVQQ
jgi:DNA-binding HxlR family transcriptional regulator